MELTPQQLAAELEATPAKAVCIVDVREAAELGEGMIPGAVHIPLDELGARLSVLDQCVPVITVCRSGRRSAAAAEQLTAAGFSARTMAGGMIGWKAAGLPVT